ncbi:MAG: hypothetical protein AAGG02_02635 [Cyanobacteria bacterium P01_H01_bin.15]
MGGLLCCALAVGATPAQSAQISRHINYSSWLLDSLELGVDLDEFGAVQSFDFLADYDPNLVDPTVLPPSAIDSYAQQLPSEFVTQPIASNTALEGALLLSDYSDLLSESNQELLALNQSLENLSSLSVTLSWANIQAILESSAPTTIDLAQVGIADLDLGIYTFGPSQRVTSSGISSGFELTLRPAVGQLRQRPPSLSPVLERTLGPEISVAQATQTFRNGAFSLQQFAPRPGTQLSEDAALIRSGSNQPLSLLAVGRPRSVRDLLSQYRLNRPEGQSFIPIVSSQDAKDAFLLELGDEFISIQISDVQLTPGADLPTQLKEDFEQQVTQVSPTVDEQFGLMQLDISLQLEPVRETRLREKFAARQASSPTAQLATKVQEQLNTTLVPGTKSRPSPVGTTISRTPQAPQALTSPGRTSFSSQALSGQRFQAPTPPPNAPLSSTAPTLAPANPALVNGTPDDPTPAAIPGNRFRSPSSF